MKKENMVFFVLLLFIFSNNYAQDYFIGIKGGINYNTIGDFKHYGEETGIGGDLTPDESTIFTPTKTLGIHYGLYVKAEFGNLFVKPEINYTSMENSYTLGLGKTTNWTSSKIEIPILIGYNIYNPISIYAGPVFSSISDRDLEGLRLTSGKIDTPIKYDKNSTSVSAGILIQYKRFGFDVRYDYGITAVKKQQIRMIRSEYGTYIADLLEYNPSQLSVSLTIDLFNFTFDQTSRSKARYDWRNPKNLR